MGRGSRKRIHCRPGARSLTRVLPLLLIVAHRGPGSSRLTLVTSLFLSPYFKKSLFPSRIEHSRRAKRPARGRNRVRVLDGARECVQLGLGNTPVRPAHWSGGGFSINTTLGEETSPVPSVRSVVPPPPASHLIPEGLGAGRAPGPRAVESKEPVPASAHRPRDGKCRGPLHTSGVRGAGPPSPGSKKPTWNF